MGRKSHRVLEIHIETVEYARQFKSLTHKAISERLGCTRQPISKFFNGKAVSCELFIGVCEMLDLNWQEIAGIQSSSVGNVPLPESTENIEQLERINGDTQIESGNYNETIQGNYYHIAGNYYYQSGQIKSNSEATPSGDISSLVNQLREQVKADIETRCGTMRILDMSQPIGLNDIYTKVNILEKISGRRRKDLAELIKSCDLENFDRFNFGAVTEKIPGKEAVSKYSTLLILGKPGAGKTTFLKHLVFQCSQGSFQGDLVPFFITLKEFAEGDEQPKLLEKLLADLNPPQSDLLKETCAHALAQILNQGKALICLDGLDEVLQADSQQVIREIESLVRQYPQNQYLMTCRIAAKEYTFTQFTEVEIADFDWEQITIFATNWFQDKPTKPETFLHRIDNDNPIKELASNPLLLTLLCLVFEESGSFPGNRAGLYREGIDALLKKWDAKRGIQRDEVYQKLWIQRKEDLLSKLAWSTFVQGEYFFKQEQAERSIGEYIRNLPGANTDEAALKLDSEAVLKSIESQHGLLVERAKKIYSFSHLTFQEYFAAREIITVRQSSDEALTELVSNIFEPRWKEVFLLAVAMSPNAERLVSLMKNKIDAEFSNNIYLQDFLCWSNTKSTISKNIDEAIAIRCFCLKELTCRELINNTCKNICETFESKTRISYSIDHYIFSLKQNTFAIMIIKLLRDDFRKRKKTTLKLLPFLNFFRILQESDEPEVLTNNNLDIEFKKIIFDLENWVLRILVNVEQNDEKWILDNSLLLDEFDLIIKEHRNLLSQKWNFYEKQNNVFYDYEYANKLLVECLHQDCYVSPEVRQEIEETLLLPIAEIEKRQRNLI